MNRIYKYCTALVLGFLLLTGMSQSAIAQCDPRFSAATYTGTTTVSGVATVLVGETGQLRFNFGVGPQPTCNASAGNAAGGLTVTLVFPAEYAPTSAAAISGTQASLYNWTYNAATRTLTGINNAPIPTGGSALFFVNVVGDAPTTGINTAVTDLTWSSTSVPPITNSGVGNDHVTAGMNVDPKPPVTTADAATTPAGVPVAITVLTNDTPGSAAIAPTTVKLVDPVSGSPVNSVTIAGQGTYTVDPVTGVVTFAPVAGFTGPVTPVSYTVNDINGVTSNPSTISVTVTPGTPPTAVNDAVSTANDTPVTVNVPANDTPGSAAIDPTSVMLIDPVAGTPTLTVTVPNQGTYTVNPATGAITFDPLPTFSGTATPVSYTVEDVNGLVSNPATVTVTVAPGTPPTAVNDAVSTANDTPVTVNVPANDTPGSAAIDPTSVMLIDPVAGTPTLTVTVPNEGTYTVNPATGVITFDPLPTFTGTATPVSYTVEDVNGLVSNPATITVTVAPGTPPTAVNDAVSTAHDTPVTVNVPANDTPGSAAIDPTSVMLIDPVAGTPTLTVTVPNEGTYTVNPATGVITFDPLPTFSGTATPVSYTVEDVNGLVSNPATVTVTVAPGTPPTAVNDAVSTAHDTPVTVNVPANDTPGSAAIDPTSVMLIDPVAGTPTLTVTVPNEGTYTVNPATGVITFDPLPTFSGTATPVSYTVEDVNGLVSNPATVTVTVAPGTPPTAVNDAVSTAHDTPVTVNVPANDTPGSAAIDPTSVMLIDPVSGTPTLTVTVPNQGTYTVNPATGVITFDPLPTFTGTATPVSYTVEDVNGLVSNPATVTVTVAPGTPPTAVPDTGTSPNGTPVDVTVLTNDTPGSAPLDPTTVRLIDPLTGNPLTSVTIPNEGTYTVNTTTGVVTFTPDPTVTVPITSTINYVVTDQNGETSNPASITITATPLPVTLTSFSVSREGKAALLNWATTEETNSDHFEIQHSVSGKDWQNVGTVASHGESKTRKTYSFTHNAPVNGENLYRLKMIDKDQTFAYSRIQGVKFEGLTSLLVSTYPNPSTDRLFIKDADLNSIKMVSIIDMNGRALFSSNKVTADGINVSKFNPGTYILYITNTNGSVSNHKIVIAK